MKNFSIISLITINLIPIFGVIFWDWNLFSILISYWSENIIIGFYNVLKMAKTEKAELNISEALGEKQKLSSKKIINIAFFIFHYGFFTFVHGIFLLTLSGIFGKSSIQISNIILMMFSFLVSHGISFYENYIGKEEYKKISLNKLFSQPYTRIVLLHITIIALGFSVALLGSPIFALILLVVLKTGIDLLAHKKEHKQTPTIQ